MSEDRDLNEVSELAVDTDLLTITQVHYQKLANLGNYENERVGAWATVLPGHTAEETLAALRVWVGQRVSDYEEFTQLQQDIFRLNSEKTRLEGSIENARQRYERARGFLHAIGLEMPDHYVRDDDMLF